MDRDMVENEKREVVRETTNNLFDDNAIKNFIDKQYKRQQATMGGEQNSLEFMTRASVLPGSIYHLFIPNELSLSNLDELDKKMVGMHCRVLSYGIYMKKMGWVTDDIPLGDAFEYYSFLNSTRAKDMAHERLMAENTLRVHKSEEPQSKTGFWGRFFKK
jgi:hypothetical protein